MAREAAGSMKDSGTMVAWSSQPALRRVSEERSTTSTPRVFEFGRQARRRAQGHPPRVGRGITELLEPAREACRLVDGE